MRLVALADGIGRGIVAGLIGTAAMTVSSTVEQRLRQRAASTAPARAASEVLGVEKFRSDAHEQRFSTLVHWGYGTGWGTFRGVLGGLGLPAPLATATHFTVMWGSELVMLPALDVAPPVTRWGADEVAIDAWHHVVHAAVTAAALRWLDRRGGTAR